MISRQGADRARGGKAVHARHLHVHQDEVEAISLRALDSLHTIADCIDDAAEFPEHVHKNLLAQRMVFGEQDALAGEVGRQRTGGSSGPLRQVPRGAWQEQLEAEGAAGARLAVHPNRTSRHGHEVLGDGQAEPAAAVSARRRCIELQEALEDMRLIGR